MLGKRWKRPAGSSARRRETLSRRSRPFCTRLPGSPPLLPATFPKEQQEALAGSKHRAAYRPGHPLPPHGGARASPQPEGRRGPVGRETPGRATALPRSRPTEIPLPSANTAAISGSPGSHFTCQQIYSSKIHPRSPSHAPRVWGRREGTCAGPGRARGHPASPQTYWSPQTASCPAAGTEPPGCLPLRLKTSLPGRRQAFHRTANVHPPKTVPPASAGALPSPPTQAQEQLQTQILVTSNQFVIISPLLLKD